MSSSIKKKESHIGETNYCWPYVIHKHDYINVNKLSSHDRAASVVYRMEVIRFCSLYAPFISTSLSMIRTHVMKIVVQQ